MCIYFSLIMNYSLVKNVHCFEFVQESDSPLSSVDTAYETDELRRELKEFGYNVGPITGGTKRVYLRQLKRTRRRPITVRPALQSCGMFEC